MNIDSFINVSSDFTSASTRWLLSWCYVRCWHFIWVEVFLATSWNRKRRGK